MPPSAPKAVLEGTWMTFSLEKAVVSLLVALVESSHPLFHRISCFLFNLLVCWAIYLSYLLLSPALSLSVPEALSIVLWAHAIATYFLVLFLSHLQSTCKACQVVIYLSVMSVEPSLLSCVLSPTVSEELLWWGGGGETGLILYLRNFVNFAKFAH